MDTRKRQAMLDEAARTIAAAVPDVWAIYVWDSMARSDDAPTSDVDLAILLPPGRTSPG